MFSEVYPDLDTKIREILSNVRTPSPERVREILNTCGERELKSSEIVELLEIGINLENREQFELMRKFTLEH